MENKPGLSFLKQNMEEKEKMIRQASLMNAQSKSESTQELIETGEILSGILEIKKERRKLLKILVR